MSARWRIIAALAGAVTASLSMATVASAQGSYWDQVFPQISDPTVDVRPKARTRAAPENLGALADAGFGSAEVGVDFAAGPEAAQRRSLALLEAARRVGMHVDWAPGGSQPYASAGIVETQSMQELLTEHIEVCGGAPFTGAIRQPARLAGNAGLVAVTAARVLRDAATPVILDVSSVIDLTSHLNPSGVLRWRVPTGHWLLFSFWQRATGQIMEGNPFQDPGFWNGRVPHLQPGQYFTADIFSAAGISAALTYLDRNVLPLDARLSQGADLAHDSLEVQAEMFWTGDLPAQFAKRRGYSVIPFLPVLYTPREASFNPLDPGWGGPLPPRPFDFQGDIGDRVRYDYRQTLTDLYSERYLKAFTDWAHSKDMKSRVEVAYNYFALDMLRSARAVDIPENESFDPGWATPFDPTVPAYGTDRWRHVIDTYRMTGSGAHLAGHHRATIEFGDDFAIYRKQPIDYAQQLNESLAGGITMGLMTAFESTATGWPVPSGGAMLGLGDAWTAGWPQWRDWRPLARYFARSTQVLESGHARVDVTIYHDRGLSTVHDREPLLASDRLERAGYTYDFIDPAALIDPQAAATRGLLYGRGVGYRALILNQQPDMPVASANAILRMARNGLRVVVIGSPPRASTGFSNSGTRDHAVVSAMSELLKLPTVAQVASTDDIAATLQRLGCPPAASFGEQSPLLSVHREGRGYDVWWIFNPTQSPVSAKASFASEGAPYVLDLWSGRTDRVPQWTRDLQRTQLPLMVMPHATTAILIHHNETPLHVLSSTAEDLLQRGDQLIVVAPQGGRYELALSNGEHRQVDVGLQPKVVNLSEWHLQVDESSPEGLRSHDLGVRPLTDWRSIPELQDAVGQGLYSASISLPSDWLGSDREVLLSVGDVAGAMQLSINGHTLTEQTTGYGRWLTGAWLRPGDNLITIRLDTTLLNRMAALRAAGDPRYQTGPTPLPPAPSGLIGPVTLTSVALLSL
jgi:hypothetical protein